MACEKCEQPESQVENYSVANERRTFSIFSLTSGLLPNERCSLLFLKHIILFFSIFPRNERNLQMHIYHRTLGHKHCRQEQRAKICYFSKIGFLQAQHRSRLVQKPFFCLESSSCFLRKEKVLQLNRPFSLTGVKGMVEVKAFSAIDAVLFQGAFIDKVTERIARPVLHSVNKTYSDTLTSLLCGIIDIVGSSAAGLSLIHNSEHCYRRQNKSFVHLKT